jgi:hypothetical protein
VRAIGSVRCLDALARSCGEHGYLIIPNRSAASGLDPFAELVDIFAEAGRLAYVLRTHAEQRDPVSMRAVLDAARVLQTELAEFVHAAEATAPSQLKAVR